MKNSTNKKNVIVKKVTITKNEKLDSTNLELLKNKLSKIDTTKKETTTKDKNYLYTFDRLDLSEKELRAKRVKLRRDLTNICNNIIIKNKKSVTFEGIKEFIDFYKTNYIVNDYTIKSITNSEKRKEELIIILDLTKEYLSTDKKEIVKKENKKEKEIIPTNKIDYKDNLVV